MIYNQIIQAIAVDIACTGDWGTKGAPIITHCLTINKKYSGCSVSSAGDVNGDGLDDLIVGAFFAKVSALSLGSITTDFCNITSPESNSLVTKW
jgi:hypothetical protein